MAGRLFTRIADSVFSLLGTLPQSQTNGASSWGTSDAPALSSFLGSQSSWGDMTVAGSQVIQDMPDTGKSPPERSPQFTDLVQVSRDTTTLQSHDRRWLQMALTKA